MGSSRQIQTSGNELTFNAAKMQYKVFQVHGYGIPTICELYFVLESDRVSDLFKVQTAILDFVSFRTTAQHTFTHAMNKEL